MVVAPALLWWSLPSCAADLTTFIRDFTVEVEGLGHVCSLSVFDIERHGNTAFGAPVDARHKAMRSRQGAIEKSLLAFHAQHPDWEPDDRGKALLAALAQHEGRQSAVWAHAAGANAGPSPAASPPGRASALQADTHAQALLQSLHEERVEQAQLQRQQQQQQQLMCTTAV